MRIVTEREIEWQGMRAWYHELSFEPSPSETGVAVAGIVVQKGPYHFYINRSLPVLDVPGALTRKLQQARKEYEGFVAGVTLK